MICLFCWRSQGAFVLDLRQLPVPEFHMTEVKLCQSSLPATHHLTQCLKALWLKTIQVDRCPLALLFLIAHAW